MKKILFFALMFIGLFAVSLACNWIFGESVHLAKMIISSLVFVLIYSAFIHYFRKGTKES